MATQLLFDVYTTTKPSFAVETSALALTAVTGQQLVDWFDATPKNGDLVHVCKTGTTAVHRVYMLLPEPRLADFVA
jgi:hypothetical protein